MKKENALESHVGFWLRYVSNHVSSAFEKRLEKWGVGVAEWVVLRNLYDENCPPSELAARIGMTRGAMSKLVDRLIDKGLVDRGEVASDRRFQELFLTKKGKKLVPELSKEADLNDDYFFGHLSNSQKKELKAVLKDIVSLKQMKKIPTE